jgi:DNA-binding transcriptional LysR family regulator
MARGKGRVPRMRTAVFDCPVAAPPAFRRLDILWHERLSRHPAQSWFRDAVAKAAG